MGIYDAIGKEVFKGAIKAAESPAAKKIGNYLAESSVGKATGKAIGNYLSEPSVGKKATEAAGEAVGKFTKEASKSSAGTTAAGALGSTAAGYYAGKSDEKDSSDSVNYSNVDSMGNPTGMKIGGQYHIEEAKERARQSRMDDYHTEQTEKAIAGVSPQDYELAQSQPIKKGSYKEGGNIHVHKGHDYIKDLL